MMVVLAIWNILLKCYDNRYQTVKDVMAYN